MTDWDRRFLGLAEHIARWSKDPSTQTGAVIARPDHRIVSVGYNGFPQAMPDRPDNYADRAEKYSRIIHCEMNALLFANASVEGCTLYTWPFISCDRCFVHMIQAGIYNFVAPKPTEDQLSRWGDAFNRVYRYAWEVDAIITELPRQL